MTMTDLIARYDGRVPRYTSYPTAPHFKADFCAETYGAWLRTLPPASPLSLYIHVPFCDRLCLYCGCNTGVVRHEGPKRAYAELLMREIRMVAEAIGRRAVVEHVHWGGGTPTTLPADCLIAIMDLLRSEFLLPSDAEVAIEIDPTGLAPDRLQALAAMGVTRASVGVQDLNPHVQAAIGRFQSYEVTEACVKDLRALGIASLNLDLIYGLPKQTVESVRDTALQGLDLQPDRIAVFGYAHVPWMKKHQALIPENTLPDAAARFAQRAAIGNVLENDGFYIPIGLDHYARPGDSLSDAAGTGELHRNFQGYTTDTAEALIGFGASAIGCLPQGYVQNAPTVPTYSAAIKDNRFAITRGIALTADDRLRREVIERIMCDLTVDLASVAKHHNADAAPLLAAADGLDRFIADGLACRHGSRIEVTEDGRPFVRNVAALFDAYLKTDATAPQHARAV